MVVVAQATTPAVDAASAVVAVSALFIVLVKVRVLMQQQRLSEIVHVLSAVLCTISCVVTINARLEQAANQEQVHRRR